MSVRHERKVGYIREAAAAFLQRESNRTSLITVTRVDLSPEGKQARIFISVLPEAKEAEGVEFLKRKRSVFREYLGKEARMHPIPFVDFAIDIGEKNRARIDELSREV